jgi:hypothetical protein
MSDLRGMSSKAGNDDKCRPGLHGSGDGEANPGTLIMANRASSLGTRCTASFECGRRCGSNFC